MMDFTKISIGLKFGHCNGAMSVDINDQNGVLLQLKDYTEDFINLTYNIKLPNKLTFTLSNKNTKYDTKLNSQGNIIADKYVNLEYITFGYIPIQNIQKICKCSSGVFDTFWGFNGIVEVEFDAISAIQWHLKHDNKFKL